MHQLMVEVGEVENEVDDLNDRLSDLDSEVEDDVSRMAYVRQLTAEFLQFLKTLTDELSPQVDIKKSEELMDKILSRSERKRYYMSKFRL